MTHNKSIIDQFTKQAVPFSKKVPAHSNELAFKLIINSIGINKKDAVLDVACGTGMLTCAIAQYAGYVIGLDLARQCLNRRTYCKSRKKYPI